MTNAEAVLQIVSRVSNAENMTDLKVSTETDGTTTFRHESVSVHLFEADRELHVRGPGSARAAQIDLDAASTGHLSPEAIERGVEAIVGFLRTRFSTQ